MAQPLNGKADLTSARVPRQPHGPRAFLPSPPFALPSVTASSHPAPAVPCMCQELLCPSFPSSWRPRPWPATRRHAGSVPRATSRLARGLCHELTEGLWKRGVCVCACIGDPLVPGAPRNPEPPRSPHPARQNPISSRLLSPAARREGPASRGCGVRLS